MRDGTEDERVPLTVIAFNNVFMRHGSKFQVLRLCMLSGDHLQPET